MAKLIVLVLASGLFFSVGLIAGQRVSSSNDKTHDRSTPGIPRTKFSSHTGTASRTADAGADSRHATHWWSTPTRTSPHSIGTPAATTRNFLCIRAVTAWLLPIMTAAMSRLP